VVRACLYLGFAGIVWIVEGFLFSRYLLFNGWQTVLMALVYVTLFALAAWRLLSALRSPAGSDMPQQVPAWRVITAAPMLAAVLGSFASLPILMAILALGKVV
jgi:hypothetical protein